MNNNIGLFAAVFLAGILSFLTFNNNISLKNAFSSGPRIQQQPTDDDYVSPFGPRPSRAWEKNWEAERNR